ncbi:phospholipase D-like domain-containing protein [Pseudoalteromonas gelatinilytica]
MSNLFSGDKLKSDLELALPYCKKLVVVSAFISKVGFEWLNNLVITNRPSVTLVGRLTPSDFLTGASDLETIKTALNEGYTVKALSNLHAKIYQIDDDLIFNGSANLTGKGLSIVSESNYEACSRVESCSESKHFIEKLVGAAVPITLLDIERMEIFLEKFDRLEMASVPATWPLNILPQPTDLLVSDFPLAQPGTIASEYELNPALPFAQIENVKSDFVLASALFKQTKAYSWLKKQITENQSERDLGFGQISRLLHDALADDPAPYRQEIKDLQANLYSYLKLYASDEIEVYMPGRRSEVVRFCYA